MNKIGYRMMTTVFCVLVCVHEKEERHAGIVKGPGPPAKPSFGPLSGADEGEAEDEGNDEGTMMRRQS